MTPRQPPGVLVLLRHGQSTANAGGVFTGWIDVPLTPDGRAEALAAGRLLGAAGLLPDVAHTSVLRRSIVSADLVLSALGRDWIPVRRTWRLNERHYGALTGRRKAEVRAEAGEERYALWRRSLDVAPPPAVPGTAPPAGDPRYAGLPPDARPATESLADVQARLLPYWADHLAPDLARGRTVLVVAHGNSLRALVAHLDALPPEQVAALNIPTGIPLRYRFTPDLRPAEPAQYLDPEAATRAAEAVAHQ
ncbi:2,3-bisphosphoglycerate-dependent phosphoglycerate mutase [Actinacidiphila epipremni]|uniref:2,3-bisphosphoglycerate-dependent phosphoglycerate mutase n=1 Tax=Actinacidiphila epipremni TaxID=2053013 RepID=A0ABX0ZUZ9_9ACTN|nr:2,3-bisphosphoglycerate-dependent phosphoglycerate mutase [Actinacidiphila epipremni]NJP46787.1 2,3-bisphosphoglycerate-dependent phosphoglycerate mutase [Actinacidiphila epipremni]